MQIRRVVSVNAEPYRSHERGLQYLVLLMIMNQRERYHDSLIQQKKKKKKKKRMTSLHEILPPLQCRFGSLSNTGAAFIAHAIGMRRCQMSIIKPIR